MRITYTAEDGTSWNNEAECMAWERFCRLLDAQDDDFTDFCADITGDCRRFGMRFVFENRSKLIQLTELMQKAILLGSVDRARSKNSP